MEEETLVDFVNENPSNPAGVAFVSETQAQHEKAELECAISSNRDVEVSSHTEEKMETNEETILVVEEGVKAKASCEIEASAKTEENVKTEAKIGNGNAETENADKEEAIVEKKQEQTETTKSSQDEVETAINEQEMKYWNAVNANPQDFTSWTYLLQFVEQENKIMSARKAFEAFLSHYPFCYGYWKKYADMEKKNDHLDRARQVFEKGVEAISLSVDLWVHYLNFTSHATKGQPNNSTAMRSLFERAISAAGEDFRSDKLWDAYIEWEKAQKQLQKVTALYDRVLTVPTQNYSKHWTKFQDHINNNPLDEVLVAEELLKLKAEAGAAPPGFTLESDPVITPPPGEDSTDNSITTDEIAHKPEDPETSAVRKKVIAQRKVLHDANELEVSKRWTFEEGIKRPYFHVKPLERVQLKNWRDYLDFEVGTGNHRRVVILFERCVIACALYEEFWQRFASYMEVHDCVEGCQNVYERACHVHLPSKPHLHLAWAAFEEKHGNLEKTREILKKLDKVVPGLSYVKLRRANLERRCKEIPNACLIYEEAITEASDAHLFSFYSIKYAKFLIKIVKDFDKAREILKTTLKRDKENKRLYLQLLDLELTIPETDEDRVDEIFELVKNSTLSDEIKEGFSQRRLEFLEDFSSNIVKITKAHEAHNKLYGNKTNQVTGKKRSSDEGPDAVAKVAKTEDSSTSNPYNQAYDATADYSTVAGYPANSTYNYNTQWPAYGTAQQPGYNYGSWYPQYTQTYAQ